jgi:uncharacterized membrane protein
MKPNGALQTIFAFFLGLLVLAFVAVALGTFYPQPEWTEGSASGYDSWRLTTGILLLVCATALLAASLVLPEDQVVLSNGILLGGVFTMVYAVVSAFVSDPGLLRFGVVTVALAVTIVIGYVRFVRGRGRAARPSTSSSEVPHDLADRLTAVEHKLDALGAALRG